MLGETAEACDAAIMNGKETPAGWSKGPSAVAVCLVHLNSFVQPNEQDRLAVFF
jgi:hypothetical protein